MSWAIVSVYQRIPKMVFAVTFIGVIGIILILSQLHKISEQLEQLTRITEHLEFIWDRIDKHFP